MNNDGKVASDLRGYAVFVPGYSRLLPVTFGKSLMEDEMLNSRDIKDSHNRSHPRIEKTQLTVISRP